MVTLSSCNGLLMPHMSFPFCADENPHLAHSGLTPELRPGDRWHSQWAMVIRVSASQTRSAPANASLSSRREAMPSLR